MRAIAILLLCALAGGARQALAQEAASPWLDLPHSRARLIAADGLAYDGRTMLAAGLEIVLAKGWKTYWRTPGDGLAPAFDWSGSGNLADAQAIWPAPKRFEGAGGTLSFGYEERLLLPFRVTPAAPGRPVGLKLKASYAVCADICVPVEAELALEAAPGADGPHRNALLAALERAPRRQGRGVFCPHSFVTAKRRTVGGKPALVIKTAFADAATGLDLFAEAPDGFDLPPPRRQPRATRGRLYHLLSFDTEKELDALKGRTLTLTMVADQGSCETAWRVE